MSSLHGMHAVWVHPETWREHGKAYFAEKYPGLLVIRYEAVPRGAVEVLDREAHDQRDAMRLLHLMGWN